MADPEEPQTGAAEGKEKMTEESTTTASVEETPESDQTTSTDKVQSANPVSEEGKKAETVAESSAQNGESGAQEGAEKAADTSKKENSKETAALSPSSVPVVSSSKKSRPPYKYDPNKITLRFLFANRDGLTVTVDYTPKDTVAEVKGALLSVWPTDLPSCSGGDRLRLICMGKGILMPDTRTLEDCLVPVFKTHPTPINVSVRPENNPLETSKSGGDKSGRSTSPGGGSGADGDQASQGCACVIL